VTAVHAKPTCLPRSTPEAEGADAAGLHRFVEALEARISHTEDLAKLGLSSLRKGIWNGKRLLRQEWVGAASPERAVRPARGAVQRGAGPCCAAAGNLTRRRRTRC
jgi:hypothetical protein